MSNSGFAIVGGLVLLVVAFVYIKKNPVGMMKIKTPRSNITPVSAQLDIGNCLCVGGVGTGAGCPFIGKPCYQNQYKYPKPGKNIFPNYSPTTELSGV